jgi:hypothetical protein
MLSRETIVYTESVELLELFLTWVGDEQTRVIGVKSFTARCLIALGIKVLQ